MRRAFTLIELLVVISIIAMLIAILLPALSSARTSARQMQNSTQLRGIHQGMFTFAQENKGWFPGIDSDGQPYRGNQTIGHFQTSGSTYRSAGYGVNVARRLAILYELDYYPTDYLISPGDENKATPDTSIPVGTDNVTPDNYSYAMLSFNKQRDTGTLWSYTALADPSFRWKASRRGQEWRDTANAQTVMLSDRAISDTGTVRNLSGVNDSAFHSLWTEPGSERWEGSVQNNDGSTTFSKTATGFKTQYAAGPTNTNDHLFFDEPGTESYANAFIVHASPQQALSAD